MTTDPNDDTDATRPPPAGLMAHVSGARGRIDRVTLDGQAFWIKRLEQLPLRMRIQKGSPDKALRREIQALRELGPRGLPVPPLVAAGSDFLVVPDCGRSLNLILRDGGVPLAEKRRAMQAAGAALAALHRAGIAHGRPSIRDFCWQHGRITLIDWERYRPGPARPARLARDAVIFVFNIYALTRGDTPEAAAAIDSYRRAAPDGLWRRARTLCRWLRWIDPLSRPLQRRDAGKGEFRAIPLTLARFAAR